MTEETTTLTDLSDQQDVIVFPEAAMIFAAVCASIFTVVGVGGKWMTDFQRLIKIAKLSCLFTKKPDTYAQKKMDNCIVGLLF